MRLLYHVRRCLGLRYAELRRLSQRSQKLAHFARCMGIALRAGRFDAFAQKLAGIGSAAQPRELLSCHEERRNVRGIVSR